ncbi:Uncharacterised protein [Mycobacteroides abscessus subsp. bolletii]|uniref:hypothetical protein n=1 Tax=Mycobacteroides abscessus TaxID=36809 RepID=UPI0009D5DEB1|nr:hypothetical protein [Mycobacteroides abscessus]SKV05751.1 Uncharacterised protein [Mycobacteroides abscessus subsp. bolletii]
MPVNVPMKWSGHSEILGALVAVGLRGTYMVQSVGREWILQGVGHDGLPMLALPAEGKSFAALDTAQLYAIELDRTRAEAQASGV